MANEIDIDREIEISTEAMRKLETQSKSLTSELGLLNKGLRLDSSNVELITEKFDVYEKQLDISQQRTAQLNNEINALNAVIASGGDTTGAYADRVKYLESQQRAAEIQTKALAGAIDNKDLTIKKATDSTNTFSSSMTELQSNLRAANQVVRGISSAFTLLGGDPDSAMGKTLEQSQKVVQIMAGLASFGKLLQGQNILTAGSFGNMALSAGAAFAAFTLASSAINAFGGDAKVVGGIITGLSAVVIAGTIAWMAYQGAKTLGVGIPIILAAVGAGIAGIQAMTKQTTDATADLSTTTTSTPRISTPSIPTASVSSSGGGATYISQGGLTEAQVEMASYRGFVRAIVETGLNEKQANGSSNRSGRQLAEAMFNDLLDVNDRRTKGFATR